MKNELMGGDERTSPSNELIDEFEAMVRRVEGCLAEAVALHQVMASDTGVQLRTLKALARESFVRDARGAAETYRETQAALELHEREMERAVAQAELVLDQIDDD